MDNSLNFKVNDTPKILEGCTDTRWAGRTIFNHFENPLDFMDTVVAHKDESYMDSKAKGYIKEGVKAYDKISQLDVTYDKLYEDVAKKVKDKLLGRGFTTSMLYATAEFTSEKTGVMSKQRALLGKRDCYFKNPNMTDGKLFHDMYINLSYSWSVSDETIRDNSYAIYALTKELARIIPMRVIVVNHVGTDTPSCYSYVLKKFGQPLKPQEFLFFTGESKRTFGWASYTAVNKADSSATVGKPRNTVSIADFNLDKEIDTIFEKVMKQMPELFKAS